MAASRSIPHLACVITLLGCISLIPHVAVADEAGDLTNAILSHLRERLPATAGPVTSTDEANVRGFARGIFAMSYYPAEPQKLAAAANAAIDEADQKRQQYPRWYKRR